MSDTMVEDVPVVRARRTAMGLEIRCPFCAKLHHHGGESGKRVPHCYNPGDLQYFILTPEDNSMMPTRPGEVGVYFAQESGKGHIKIGLSTNIPARIRQLNTCAPHEVKLLGRIFPADGDLVKEERRLHVLFAAHRQRGEWFWPSPELLEFIEGLP